MSATPRGCSACTNTGCYGPASGPRARSRPCGAICASASGCWMWAAAHIQHMQKALTEMNLQLHHVVADVTGVTGLRILRALVAGERDPDTLAAYQRPALQGPGRDPPRGPGRQLPGGARLRPGAGPGAGSGTV